MLRILSFINKTQYEIKSSPNQKLKIEMALCQLIGLEKSSTITELISKLNSGTMVMEPPKKIYSSSGGGNTAKNTHNNSVSNVRPAFKDEIKIPEVKSFVAPTAHDASEFEEIIEKWQNFVDEVKSEKLFGSVLNNSNPIDFLNNRLKIEIEHPDDWGIISDHKDYLDKKTKEMFGKKIEFDKAAGDKTKSQLQSKSSLNNTSHLQAANDEIPLINELINQLGAKEIKR